MGFLFSFLLQGTPDCGVLNPNQCIYNATTILKAQKPPQRREQNDSKSQRTRMFSVREYLLYTTGAEPIKSEEYGHLKKISTMTAPVDTPAQMEEIS